MLFRSGYNNAYVKQPTTDYENFIFTNSMRIEKGSNFEGSIQINYIITPYEMRDNSTYSIPRHENETIVESTQTLNSTLTYGNSEITSNDITYNYRRVYNHPWIKKDILYSETVSKLNGYDGLPSGAENYIWVKYNYDCGGAGSSYYVNNVSTYYSSYPQIGMSNSTAEVQTTFPDNVVVYGAKTKNRLYPDETTGKYKIYYDETVNTTYSTRSVLVGYPKEEYNAENNNLLVQNESEYYGYWLDDIDNLAYLNRASVSLNLNNYVISMPSKLYRVSKSTTNKTMRNLAIERKFLDSEDNLAYYKIETTIYYSGNTMKVEVGDDILLASNIDGSISKLSDDEYFFEEIYPFSNVYNINNERYKDGEHTADVYVRYQNENDYVKLKTVSIPSNECIDLTDSSKKVVGFYLKTDALDASFISSTGVYIRFLKEDIPENGYLYNSDYTRVFFQNDNYTSDQNSVDASSYNSSYNDILKEHDLNRFGNYVERGYSYVPWNNELERKNTSLVLSKNSSYKQNDEKKVINGKYVLGVEIETWAEYDYHYINDYSDDYYIHGFHLYDLLPKGVNINSSEEEIKDSITHSFIWENSYKIVFFDKNRTRIDKEQAYQIIKDNVSVNVIKNYKGTGRDYINIECDLTSNPLLIFSEQYISSIRMLWDVNYIISYDSLLEYGNSYTNHLYIQKYDEDIYLKYSVAYSNLDTTYDVGTYDNEFVDMNENGITNETLLHISNTTVVNYVVASYQDVQTSVQSDKRNFDTGRVDTSNDSEYSYKLRVRTGTNDVTNLVIYDSLEKYAKDSNMASVLASGGRRSWQGEFLGIDTSYAESKGYTVRTYYSESETPGSLSDDDSWVLYTDSVDKSKVKSLAFEYLDSSGNPAVLSANSLTYVLIRMKSPADEELKTLAYNGCWTEWNAIDSITGQTVDFITGINSNIVKVALPKSVEPIDIDLDINKYWKDNNNSLGIRPDTITVKLVPNNDLTKAINVPLGTTNVVSGNSNHWKTSVSVPKYDEDGEVIDYSLRENEIILEDGYKYTPTIEDNNVTNTLVKEIELKKIWKDNNNSYLTRPTSVTYMVKQNNNDYKEVTFTGDYSTDEWTKIITVPVFDSSNREYVYTVEEYNVDNYSINCSGYVCTNTLTGNKNINITKEWNDKDNEYNTRPDNIKVNLLRNGNLYQEVTLSGNDWNSNNIEVPLYDENGVKYNYTISEDNVDEYGLVEYDQNNYKVTNTLKKKINLVIKKIWVDDNNSNNTRPNELNITLLRDGENYQTVTLTGDTNEWTTTVEVDKYDENQNKYKYSIKEVNDSISDLYNNVTYSEDELTVTNTLGEITNLTISKKWIDHNNEYMTRPDSVKINLLQDGVMYREVTISKDKEWKEVINNIPVYDSNHNRHIYTIEESVSVSKYGKVTYDQTNLEITNELTEVPTVSLYFTVVNGYVDPMTGEMKYDDFGLNEILKKYNKTIEDEYIFTFELKNLDSGKLYDGKLSTQGILEFRDIPYGEYKAVEGDDNLFDFVDMLSIEEVNGVSFRREGNEGYISIRPTGENIVFGAKIVNKIIPPINNPNTGIVIELLILFILLLPIIYSLYLLSNRIKSQ